jgi:hypothetical protein
MLSRIFIFFNGVVTLSGAGANSDLGPWNILSRIGVNANIGATSLWDTSGFGGYVANYQTDLGYAPDKAGTGNTTPDPLLFSAPAAAGANNWALWWILNVGANQGTEFDAGLMNLQAPEIRVTVDLQCGPLTDPNPLCTAISGTFTIYYEYYELPDPAIADLPPLMVVRTLEESQPVTGTGDVIYTLPRMGSLLYLVHYLIANGTRSNGYDKLSLKFNKTTTIYEQDKALCRLLNREFTEQDFPTGVAALDFWHATQDLSAGDNRDTVDTEEISTVESILTVSSGTVLGANNNFLRTVRRITQVYAA